MIEFQFDWNPALEVDRAASFFQLGLLAFHLNEPKIELFFTAYRFLFMFVVWAYLGVGSEMFAYN